jgi:PadR family transcriptional regulator PadR
MRGKKREKIFKGIISLLILRLLWDSPQYGYALENELNDKLAIKLSDGEIYSILRNMEIRKLLKSYVITEKGRMRRYYQINDDGRKFLMEHITPLKIAYPLIGEIIGFIESVRDKN